MDAESLKDVNLQVKGIAEGRRADRFVISLWNFCRRLQTTRIWKGGLRPQRDGYELCASVVNLRRLLEQLTAHAEGLVSSKLRSGGC